MWQTVLRGVVRKRVTVEPRESLGRAEPQKAVAVANDPVDAVLRKTIRRGVALDGQLLSASDEGTRQRNAYRAEIQDPE